MKKTILKCLALAIVSISVMFSNMTPVFAWENDTPIYDHIDQTKKSSWNYELIASLVFEKINAKRTTPIEYYYDAVGDATQRTFESFAVATNLCAYGTSTDGHRGFDTEWGINEANSYLSRLTGNETNEEIADLIFTNLTTGLTKNDSVFSDKYIKMAMGFTDAFFIRLSGKEYGYNIYFDILLGKANTPDIVATPTPEPTVTPTITPVPTAPTVDYSSLQQSVFELTNQQRANDGVNPLVWDETLATAAQGIRAEEIAESFSHTRPDGSSFYTSFNNGSYMSIGENIASGYATPELVIDGWMNSAGHRANILDKDYTSIGIGVYRDNDGHYYWVQIFGKDNSVIIESPTPTMKPTATPTATPSPTVTPKVSPTPKVTASPKPSPTSSVSPSFKPTETPAVSRFKASCEIKLNSDGTAFTECTGDGSTTEEEWFAAAQKATTEYETATGDYVEHAYNGVVHSVPKPESTATPIPTPTPEPTPIPTEEPIPDPVGGEYYTYTETLYTEDGSPYYCTYSGRTTRTVYEKIPWNNEKGYVIMGHFEKYPLITTCSGVGGTPPAPTDIPLRE